MFWWTWLTKASPQETRSATQELFGSLLLMAILCCSPNRSQRISVCMESGSARYQLYAQIPARLLALRASSSSSFGPCTQILRSTALCSCPRCSVTRSLKCSTQGSALLWRIESDRCVCYYGGRLKLLARPTTGVTSLIRLVCLRSRG